MVTSPRRNGVRGDSRTRPDGRSIGSRLTRREALGLGGTATLGVLAGCSGIFGEGGSDGDATPTLTPVALPGGDGDSSEVTGVGAVADLGDVAMVVEAAERLERAVVLGFEIRSRPGNELLAVTAAFENTSDQYLSLNVYRFEVAVRGGFAQSIEPFVERTSADLGGWAFAPGEVRTVTLHYQVPERANEARLHGAMRIRALPEDSFDVASVVTDLTSTVASPTDLEQSLSGPINDVGETVSAAGISVHVRDVTVPADVPNSMPASGIEYLAVDLSVTNDGHLSFPVVVGVGGIGGMVLADDEGNAFTDRVWFAGEGEGEPRYDDALALAPGETNEGTTVVEVPAGASPLYLLWTPPVAGWQVGSGVAVNRFVWRVR